MQLTFDFLSQGGELHDDSAILRFREFSKGSATLLGNQGYHIDSRRAVVVPGGTLVQILHNQTDGLTR